jgi:hypothetical protein
MTHLSTLRFSARCPGCLRIHALLPSGDLYRHTPCGPKRRPAPTVLGMELPGHLPFPEDVTRVVDRNGIELHRTPQGWALRSGRLRGLWAQADMGPYLVTAIEPAA